MEPQDGERAQSSLNNSTQTDLGGLVSMSASVLVRQSSTSVLVQTDTTLHDKLGQR